MSSLKSCAVKSCQSDNHKLFRCPESRNQLKKWKSILEVSEREFYVCELHFDAHFINYEKVLSDEAVPTLFINENLHHTFCACCSSPISEGHQISSLHRETCRILFNNSDLNGEFVCTYCNDQITSITDFIKIVEGNKRNFEYLDVEMKEPIVKIEPEQYEVVEEEEMTEIKHNTLFLKTEDVENNSDQEMYEAESNESSKSMPKHSKKIKMLRKCDLCNFSNRDRDLFMDHIRKVHAVDDNTNDLECDFEENEEIDSNSFNGTKQSRECDICREVFTDKKLLIDHFKAHFDKDKIYNCPFCDKTCKGIVMLGFHKNLDHKGDELFCICHRTFKRIQDMKKCRRNHKVTLVDRKYVCDECDSYVAFGDFLKLGHHKTKIHGNGKRFWCIGCGKLCLSKKEYDKCLKQHRDVLGNIVVKCPECSKLMPYSRIKLHRTSLHFGVRNEICEICGLGFPTKGLLNAHRRFKHINRSENITFQCDLCGKKYYSKGNLQSHMVKHRRHENHECTICLKKNLKKLDVHMKKSHPNNYDNGARVNPETNLFHCPNCIQNFDSLKLYERHIKENVCSNFGICEVEGTKKVGTRTEGKFTCRICNSVKKSIVKLRIHMSQMHSGAKVCPICNRTSKNVRQLTKHVNKQHKMSMKDLRNTYDIN